MQPVEELLGIEMPRLLDLRQQVRRPLDRARRSGAETG